MKSPIGRFLAIIAFVLVVSPVVMLNDIQRWRAGRSVKAQALEACRATADEKACKEAIDAHHATCAPIGIHGTHWFDGPRADVAAYQTCLVNPTAPEQARGRHALVFKCSASDVDVYVSDPSSGYFDTRGCGEEHRWKCVPPPTETAHDKFYDAPLCSLAP